MSEKKYLVTIERVVETVFTFDESEIEPEDTPEQAAVELAPPPGSLDWEVVSEDVTVTEIEDGR